MPYRFYHDGEILRLDFDKNVSIAEVTEIGRKVVEIESAAPVVPHRIVDLSQTSGSNLRFEEILAFAQQRKTQTFANPFKSAIVAPTAVQRGIARMFTTLNDHPQITIRIFPDVEAAKAWIAGEKTD